MSASNIPGKLRFTNQGGVVFGDSVANDVILEEGWLAINTDSDVINIHDGVTKGGVSQVQTVPYGSKGLSYVNGSIIAPTKIICANTNDNRGNSSGSKYRGCFATKDLLISELTIEKTPSLSIGDTAEVITNPYVIDTYVWVQSQYDNSYFWAWDKLIKGGLIYSTKFYDFPNTYEGTSTWISTGSGRAITLSYWDSTSPVSPSRSTLGRKPIIPVEAFKLGCNFRWRFVGGYPMFDTGATFSIRIQVNGKIISEIPFTRSNLFTYNPTFPTGNVQKGGDWSGWFTIQPDARAGTMGTQYSSRGHSLGVLDAASSASWTVASDTAVASTAMPSVDQTFAVLLYSSVTSPNAGIHDYFELEVVA